LPLWHFRTKAVVEKIQINDYAWSPDGKTIAYSKVGALVFHEFAPVDSIRELQRVLVRIPPKPLVIGPKRLSMDGGIGEFPCKNAKKWH
jgi:hypothetical protein